jgi:hypothetical protein
MHILGVLYSKIMFDMIFWCGILDSNFQTLVRTNPMMPQTISKQYITLILLQTQVEKVFTSKTLCTPNIIN